MRRGREGEWGEGGKGIGVREGRWEKGRGGGRGREEGEREGGRVKGARGKLGARLLPQGDIST